MGGLVVAINDPGRPFSRALTNLSLAVVSSHHQTYVPNPVAWCGCSIPKKQGQKARGTTEYNTISHPTHRCSHGEDRGLHDAFRRPWETKISLVESGESRLPGRDGSKHNDANEAKPSPHRAAAVCQPTSRGRPPDPEQTRYIHDRYQAPRDRYR